MTAYEIYDIINKLESPEYYEIAIQNNVGDIEGACKIIQDCFECDKQTANEVIEIMNKVVEDSLRSKGIEPLTREQMNINNEVERLRQENRPKCPTCNSTNIKKISSFSKVAGASMFGLLSKTARSQFQCNNCGYKW